MSIDFKNKKIGILGLGIENEALARWIIKHRIGCDVTICDRRSEAELGDRFKTIVSRKTTSVSWRLGGGFNKDLADFDILFRAPGWPMSCPGIQQAIKQRMTNADFRISNFVYSPMRLFFDLCPTTNIIGVTGTKGKGTTSSLIYEVLRLNSKSKIKNQKSKIWLGGNIGVAPFVFLDKVKKDDWVVLEMSSFQLEDFTTSPHIAVITNLYPEHLSAADPLNPNYHKNLADYWRSKSNIIKWQKRGDVAIINMSLKTKAVKCAKSKLILYDKSDLKSQLIGEYNRKNVAAAEAVGKYLKIDNKIVAQAVKRFSGLPFRLQKIAEKHGIQFYNDSFATTPEASIMALDSFQKGKIILMAGGADKGADFRKFAKKIKQKVKTLVLFRGKGSDRLATELRKQGFTAYVEAGSMAEAFAAAMPRVASGDVVLMSTGCASFGVFKNYKDRGSLFNAEVEKFINITPRQSGNI